MKQLVMKIQGSEEELLKIKEIFFRILNLSMDQMPPNVWEYSGDIEEVPTEEIPF